MRILYVTRQYPPHGVGGIGTYVRTLAGLMRDAGHDVTVLTASPAHGRSSEVIDGITVERFGVVGPRWLWRRLQQRSEIAAARLHAALSAWIALRRLRAHFDVIEAPEWKAEGLLLRWPRRAPVVIHLHLPLEIARRWRRVAGAPPRGVVLAEWMERRSVLHADAVTATSELSRSLPDGARWCPDTAVSIVPPPMVVESWHGLPPVEATDPVVLFLGHLEHRKAPEVLLDALGMLVAEVPGLRAVLVGRSFAGPGGQLYEAHLRQQADQLGVPCDIRAPRSGTAAMRELYAGARVVAVPSRYETLSMVVLEGFASGRPVVMTEAVGAKEWLGGAVPDLIVPPDDPAALAAALRPLLLEPAAARRCAEGGRGAVVEACAVESIVRSREAAYGAARDRTARRRRTVRRS